MVQRRDRVGPVPVRTRVASETVILNNEFSVDAVERKNSPLNHSDSAKEKYALAKRVAFLHFIVWLYICHIPVNVPKEGKNIKSCQAIFSKAKCHVCKEI